jgi:DNA invertase Pin-like site-specific DNA recombinase
MKVLYVRTSSISQKTDRQRITENEFNLVIEDKCSGAIPFFERSGGKEILNLVEKNAIKELFVWQIDRLGRNVRDIMNTIHFFTSKGISISFISQGLKTLDENGKENPISKMVISILGVIAEMGRNQIKENQMEGIKIAKVKGLYKGRKKGSNEDLVSFINKEKNKKAIVYMKKGYKNIEISKIVGIHINTLTKIKNVGEQLGILGK